MSKTIAIDFDGVIHKYSKGWQNGEIYDEPVEGVMQAIHNLLLQDYSVFIFSTRDSTQISNWLENASKPYGVAFGHMVIPESDLFWNQKYMVGITNRKLPAHCYIDDRALKFNGNWIETIQEISNFKTYQQ